MNESKLKEIRAHAAELHVPAPIEPIDEEKDMQDAAQCDCDREDLLAMVDGLRAAIARDIVLFAERYVGENGYTDSAKAQGWAIMQAAAMVRDGG